MKCPYCNGETSFDNSNLSHKYRHSCRNYFKICPICSTKYSTENSFLHSECKIVENIFDVDYCKECNRAWLPDFPTSWTRSFTNLNKIYEFIQDIFNNEQKSINADNLFNIQRSHFGVIYNPNRAKLRGVEEYIVGAGRRRMLEYFNVLKNMGVLKIKDDISGSVNHEFTRFGEEIASSSNPKDLLSYFIISYLNIKLNNGFQRKQKNSCYRYFKIRFAHNLLSAIKYLNEKGVGASKYQIGLSFLARDDKQFKEYCLDYIDSYSSNMIKHLFFEDETELNRAVTSTFINVFQSMNIIRYKDELYYLTELGKEIVDLLESRPAIWFEDIEKYADNTGEDVNDIFARLLIWRLVKNNMVDESEVDISLDLLNTLVQNIVGIPIEQISDIHVNLYYDEPMYKHSFDYTFQITDYVKKYLDKRLEISTNEVEEMCELLMFAWYSDIYSIVDKQGELTLTKFVNSADNIFKSNMQSGREWHEKSKQLFNQIGLKTVDYKDTPFFSHCIIDRLSLMLPGGTVHNPDLLILESGIGAKNCILVDAKDQNSINSELPKLMGYSLYSKHPSVDSYTIIALRGELPTTTKQRIESSLEDFERVTIIEENALEKLVSKSMTKHDILDLIIPKNGFKYINSNML